MDEKELNKEISIISREGWAAVNEELVVQKVKYSFGTAYSALSELNEAIRPLIVRSAVQEAVRQLRTIQEKINSKQLTIDDIDDIIEEHIEKLQGGG